MIRHFTSTTFGHSRVFALHFTPALAAFEFEPPHIMVSDIGMPDQDGYELMRSIRRLAKDKGGGIPSIALTAFASVQDKSLALAAGFHSHLAKPVDPAEFLMLVKNVVAKNYKSSDAVLTH